MKLYFYRAHLPNFGDELNLTMWQHILPKGFLDGDDRELFLGIGSILFDRFPRQVRKLVVGSGFGAYSPPPNMHDGSWEVLFVRGPLTAERLGLDRRLAICDAAVLLRETPLPPPRPGIRAAFMPHVDSVERGNWREVCRLADVTYIDPTGDVDDIVSTIRGARVVITEAMHGAIVSDALRTPWVAVRPLQAAHRFKWDDWAGALGIRLRQHRLRPSNLREAWAGLSGLDARGGRTRVLLDGVLARPGNALVAQRAARQLEMLADSDPQLSGDAEIERATERAMTAIDSYLRRRRQPRRARSQA
jgi:succinoglycan biosynthesis protein ExoV